MSTSWLLRLLLQGAVRFVDHGGLERLAIRRIITNRHPDGSVMIKLPSDLPVWHGNLFVDRQRNEFVGLVANEGAPQHTTERHPARIAVPLLAAELHDALEEMNYVMFGSTVVLASSAELDGEAVLPLGFPIRGPAPPMTAGPKKSSIISISDVVAPLRLVPGSAFCAGDTPGLLVEFDHFGRLTASSMVLPLPNHSGVAAWRVTILGAMIRAAARLFRPEWGTSPLLANLLDELAELLAGEIAFLPERLRRRGLLLRQR
ncbi:MAG: hypothetical protein HY825_16040 [Acidobacteria bacterium]|nr:hypothetical protein [Acidobacteriota bacterium]